MTSLPPPTANDSLAPGSRAFLEAEGFEVSFTGGQLAAAGCKALPNAPGVEVNRGRRPGAVRDAAAGPLPRALRRAAVCQSEGRQQVLAEELVVALRGERAHSGLTCASPRAAPCERASTRPGISSHPL